MILIMGAIFYLSNQSFANTPPLFPGFDKLAHFVIYGALGLSILYAQSAETRKSTLKAGVWVVVIATLYGISDEFHQSFVPGRQPDVFDLVADSLGALGAVALWSLIKRFSSN